ncbi:MAG: YqgE/AlgH family protein [Rhodospirillales bacterium]|nr:YqgE/AlgH family protein [Rhodospirillales bacterium]
MRAIIATFIIVLLSITGGAQADDFRSLKGYFLIASPEMDDPNFAQSVILMIEHDQSAALGLILNRPMAKGPLKALFKPLGIEETEDDGNNEEISLHLGGPVELSRAFVLHSQDYEGQNTVKVIEGVSLTANQEVLQAIAQGKGPKRYFLLMGYAGWAAGQLEGELKRGGWETAPGDIEIILDNDAKTKWQRAMDLVDVGI